MKRLLFIEGVSGAGKSTLSAKLAGRLQALGHFAPAFSRATKAARSIFASPPT
jgi:thymidylate kinase